MFHGGCGFEFYKLTAELAIDGYLTNVRVYEILLCVCVGGGNDSIYFIFVHGDEMWRIKYINE